VTADDLSRWIDEGLVVVLDVRTYGEYAGENGYPCDPRQGHIPGSVHVEWERRSAATR
jgi:3-mercaptopyruvate sulfurtransferase SseA